MKTTALVSTALVALALASPAYAASDYLLQIEGVKGAAATSATVESWSFGVCNAGACSSGSTKRTIASQNSQSLRESPTRASIGKTAVTEDAGAKGTAPRGNWDLATNKGARSLGGGGAGGQVNLATGDVDGDGLADLAFVQTQPEVSSLSFTFQQIPAEFSQALCDGKHIDKATLRGNGDEYEITDATVSCSSSAASRAMDPTPTRISTNMTVGKQTQQSSFGERCNAGMSCAGAMTITFTSGQMKHTKTGHVTLMK